MMKRRKLAVTVLAFALAATNVNAAVIDKVEEAADGENSKKVTVYGTIPEIESKNPAKNRVTLEVLYPGENENSFADKDKSKIVKYMAQTAANDDGEYTFDFTMDSASGKYLIRIGYLGGTEKMNYDYVSPAEFSELFEKIAEALKKNDGTSLKSVIDDFTKREIITIDKYEELKDKETDTTDIFAYMAGLEKIDDISALVEAFSDGYAVVCAENADSFDDIIKDEELSEILGISQALKNMYNDLSEEVQKQIFASAKTSLDSKDKFVESMVGGIIKNTFKNILWQEVYGAVYDNNTLFGIDFADYNALSSKKQEYALEYFAKNSSQCVDAESVKDLFEESVKKGKAYTSSSGGSSGTSSSPSGGMMSSVTPSVTEKIDDSVFTPPVFDDLDSVEWAREAIEALSAEKIVNGKEDGKFCPNDTIKREEFVKMIVELFDLYGDFYTSEFIDVDDGAWYSEYIIAASENGIINGISPYEFGVGKNIKRKDMAVIIYRILQSDGVSFESTKSTFSDVSEDYAESAIAGLSEKKIMNGVSDSAFAPEKNATRAEAAVLIYNVMKYLR